MTYQTESLSCIIHKVLPLYTSTFSHAVQCKA